ncbi:MAG: hypothetical protein GW946_04015 [Candidatus Pacebacteria bacterium]|nr:hypothetical protein [Candidatus Paceibacterota bacterium]PIR59965.1 MAG: hypothetical protein COU67_04250 [Candidatus Pacebacteria bacterium CG10_big_fil_rev_8_21_14_0_10_44_54]
MVEKTKPSQAIQELTEQIEARKRQQELVRTLKQQKKSVERRRHRIERLTAPILFLVSIFISAVVLLLF